MLPQSLGTCTSIMPSLTLSVFEKPVFSEHLNSISRSFEKALPVPASKTLIVLVIVVI
ncbi:MAG: hypothetical protein QXI10_01450 [Candidatus Diapherotrites archaeon]